MVARYLRIVQVAGSNPVLVIILWSQQGASRLFGDKSLRWMCYASLTPLPSPPGAETMNFGEHDLVLPGLPKLLAVLIFIIGPLDASY